MLDEVKIEYQKKPTDPPIRFMKIKPGKKTKLRLKTRRAWIKANPPNHQGYYTCGICRRQVHQSEMELDHILPSSNRPDLIADFDNLQPTHSICNRLKGSKHDNRRS